MNILNTVLGIPNVLAQGVNAGEIANETEGQLTQLVAFIINQIPLWITAFIIMVLTFVVARMVKSAVENKMATQGFEEENKEVAILASRTANAAVLTIGITVALKIAGIDLTAIIAAAAFGVGFALRDIIMNFIAGVMLLSSRHYTIGDVIKVKGTMGKIVEIQTRATILKAFDGTKIIVPNAELFKNEVISFTSNPFRKVKLINGVNYGEDLQRTMEVVMEAVRNTKGVLAEPKPKMAFTEWGPYSINYKVSAWVESRGGWVKIRTAMILNITKALEEAGIEIPYPIQTIEISDEEKKAEKLITEKGEKKNALTQLKPAPVAVKSGPLPSPENIDAPMWLKKASQDTALPEKQEAAAEPEPKPEPKKEEVAVGAKPIPGIKPVEEQPSTEQAPADVTQVAPTPETEPQQPAAAPLTEPIQETAPTVEPASTEAPVEQAPIESAPAAPAEQQNPPPVQENSPNPPQENPQQ